MYNMKNAYIELLFCGIESSRIPLYVSSWQFTDTLRTSWVWYAFISTMTTLSVGMVTSCLTGIYCDYSMVIFIQISLRHSIYVYVNVSIYMCMCENCICLCISLCMYTYVYIFYHYYIYTQLQSIHMCIYVTIYAYICA